MSHFIDTSGMITFRVWEADRPSLAEAQEHVGGLVELIELTSGWQMLVNEEGLMMNLPVNIGATLYAERLIVGPVLILVGDARWGEDD